MSINVTDGLRKYFERTQSQPEVAIQIWRRSLAEWNNGNHVPMDATVREVLELQRPIFLEVMRRTSLIPPRGSRSAGRAYVQLALHLADVLTIPDQLAHRVLQFCYEHNGQKPPINDATSFRVVKQRITPAA